MTCTALSPSIIYPQIHSHTILSLIGIYNIVAVRKISAHLRGAGSSHSLLTFVAFLPKTQVNDFNMGAMENKVR